MRIFSFVIVAYFACILKSIFANNQNQVQTVSISSRIKSFISTNGNINPEQLRSAIHDVHARAKRLNKDIPFEIKKLNTQAKDAADQTPPDLPSAAKYQRDVENLKREEAAISSKLTDDVSRFQEVIRLYDDSVDEARRLDSSLSEYISSAGIKAKKN